MKIFFAYIFPLLFPLACWFAWQWWLIKKNKDLEKKPVPWSFLLIAGTILAIIITFMFFTDTKYSPDLIYTPPRYENGRIIPAQMGKPK